MFKVPTHLARHVTHIVAATSADAHQGRVNVQCHSHSVQLAAYVLQVTQASNTRHRVLQHLSALG
jgi:hypothetical protein